MIRRKKAPQKKRIKTPFDASPFTAEVMDLTSDGRAVLRHPSGQVYFAAGVWPGEVGEFKPSDVKGRVGNAELIELKDASPKRVDAHCPHYGSDAQSCGGCPWQFIEYEAQLEAKQERVKQAAQKLNAEDKLKPIIASEKRWGYRNRAQLKTDGEQLGYVAARSNSLVDVTVCPVLSEANKSTLGALRKKLPEKSWRASKKKLWTTIDLDESVDGESVSINRRLPFQQGNTLQNNNIKAWLLERLKQVENKGSALELFCGSGNFTETLLAAGFKNIIASEASEESIKTLKVRYPQINAQVVNLFVENALSKLVYEAKHATTLLLDPPREGLKVREPILKKMTSLKYVFYISCDLATFSRDLEDFQTAGFSIQELQPIDLFPQTPHVELMALLLR